MKKTGILEIMNTKNIHLTKGIKLILLKKNLEKVHSSNSLSDALGVLIFKTDNIIEISKITNGFSKLGLSIN